MFEMNPKIKARIIPLEIHNSKLPSLLLLTGWPSELKFLIQLGEDIH